MQLFLRGLSGHPGGPRGLGQCSALGPMDVLHVPTSAELWRPQEEARLEPQTAGVLRQ